METHSATGGRWTIQGLPQVVPNCGFNLLLQERQQLGQMRLHQGGQAACQLLLQCGTRLHQGRLNQLLHQFLRHNRWRHGHRCRSHWRHSECGCWGHGHNRFTHLLPGTTHRQQRVAPHQLGRHCGGCHRLGWKHRRHLGRGRRRHTGSGLAWRDHLGQGGHVFGWDSWSAGHAVQAGAD